MDVKQVHVEDFEETSHQDLQTCMELYSHQPPWMLRIRPSIDLGPLLMGGADLGPLLMWAPPQPLGGTSDPHVSHDHKSQPHPHQDCDWHHLK